MTTKSEHFVDLIFKKLKNYKKKELFLEKKTLKRFIFSLLKENWNILKLYDKSYTKKNTDNIMFSMSSLTFILIVTFIGSLYFLFKVTSNANN